MEKTFHIRTYGCQMNERDSEALACLLETEGFRRVDGEEKALIRIFNTCSVRDQSERKVIGKIGILRKLKAERPETVIAVIGCMAQNHAADILARLPHVDLVVGTDQVQSLPVLIRDALAGRRGIVAVAAERRAWPALDRHKPGQVSAFVAIMRGCNEFCSYCIVPFVRGREKSRERDDILREVTTLVRQGTREIFLLGQNITAYGLAEARAAGTYTPEISPFADLLRAVSDVPGVARIRFTSPHPKYMNDAFIEAVCSLPKVCNALHVPLQSGSDRILKLMGRGYTVAQYLERIACLRQRLEQVTFSTDVIVGFPGESDAEFAATRQVMNEVGYDMAYVFRYSPRTGTAAAKRLLDDVPADTKMARNKILLADLEARTTAANSRLVGHTLEVLVDGPSKRNPRRWSGRTDLNKVCIFETVPGLSPGDLARVKINRVSAHSLFGKIQAPDRASACRRQPEQAWNP